MKLLLLALVAVAAASEDPAAVSGKTLGNAKAANATAPVIALKAKKTAKKRSATLDNFAAKIDNVCVQTARMVMNASRCLAPTTFDLKVKSASFLEVMKYYRIEIIKFRDTWRAALAKFANENAKYLKESEISLLDVGAPDDKGEARKLRVALRKMKRDKADGNPVDEADLKAKAERLEQLDKEEKEEKKADGDWKKANADAEVNWKKLPYGGKTKVDALRYSGHPDVDKYGYQKDQRSGGGDQDMPYDIMRTGGAGNYKHPFPSSKHWNFEGNAKYRQRYGSTYDPLYTKRNGSKEGDPHYETIQEGFENTPRTMKFNIEEYAQTFLYWRNEHLSAYNALIMATGPYQAAAKAYSSVLMQFAKQVKHQKETAMRYFDGELSMQNKMIENALKLYKFKSKTNIPNVLKTQLNKPVPSCGYCPTKKDEMCLPQGTYGCGEDESKPGGFSKNNFYLWNDDAELWKRRFQLIEALYTEFLGIHAENEARENVKGATAIKADWYKAEMKNRKPEVEVGEAIEKNLNRYFDKMTEMYGLALDFKQEESFMVAYLTSRDKFDRCSTILKRRIPGFQAVDNAKLEAEKLIRENERKQNYKYETWVIDLLNKYNNAVEGTALSGHEAMECTEGARYEFQLAADAYYYNLERMAVDIQNTADRWSTSLATLGAAWQSAPFTTLLTVHSLPTQMIKHALGVENKLQTSLKMADEDTKKESDSAEVPMHMVNNALVEKETTGGDNCPTACKKCSAGTGTGGAALDGGKCTNWCSLDGECGISGTHQGGTNCADCAGTKDEDLIDSFQLFEGQPVNFEPKEFLLTFKKTFDHTKKQHLNVYRHFVYTMGPYKTASEAYLMALDTYQTEIEHKVTLWTGSAEGVDGEDFASGKMFNNYYNTFRNAVGMTSVATQVSAVARRRQRYIAAFLDGAYHTSIFRSKDCVKTCRAKDVAKHEIAECISECDEILPNVTNSYDGEWFEGEECSGGSGPCFLDSMLDSVDLAVGREIKKRLFSKFMTTVDKLESERAWVQDSYKADEPGKPNFDDCHTTIKYLSLYNCKGDEDEDGDKCAKGQWRVEKALKHMWVYVAKSLNKAAASAAAGDSDDEEFLLQKINQAHKDHPVVMEEDQEEGKLPEGIKMTPRVEALMQSLDDKPSKFARPPKALISEKAVVKQEKNLHGLTPSALLEMQRESPWIYSATVGKRCKQESDCGAPEFWCPNGQLKYSGAMKKCEVAAPVCTEDYRDKMSYCTGSKKLGDKCKEFECGMGFVCSDAADGKCEQEASWDYKDWEWYNNAKHLSTNGYGFAYREARDQFLSCHTTLQKGLDDFMDAWAAAKGAGMLGTTTPVCGGFVDCSAEDCPELAQGGVNGVTTEA
jgi:hypothetical protein